MSIISFDKLESTNSYGKENIEVLKHLDIIFTSLQTNGRGRTSHTWEATTDSLTFSIILKDEYIFDHFEAISLLSATSIYEVLSKYIDNLSIKWPNDLLVNDKKLVGMLMEGVCYSSLEGIVLGIGVNVNNKSMPLDTATSMYLETKKEYSIIQIRDEIIKKFIENIDKYKNGDRSYLDIINSNNYLFNKKAYATIGNKRKYVTIGKILSNNHLQVISEDGIEEVSTDEISFHN